MEFDNFFYSIGGLALLILLLLVIFLLTTMIISRIQKRRKEESIWKYETEHAYNSFANGLKELKNLSMDFPDRMKNLKLVFCNIKAIRKKDYTDDLMQRLDVCICYDKKTMVREIAYEYLYDLLSYFSEKYNCNKSVELHIFKNAYQDAIKCNLETDLNAKFDVLEIMIINFSDITLVICDKMTENNFNKDVKVKCRTKLLKESFELEEMVLQIKMKNEEKNLQSYTKILEKFDHKSLNIIGLFDFIERNL